MSHHPGYLSNVNPLINENSMVFLGFEETVTMEAV